MAMAAIPQVVGFWHGMGGMVLGEWLVNGL
jgi:hypothetical protein